MLIMMIGGVVLACFLVQCFADDRMEIFYINLKRSVDRNDAMKRHLERLSYPFQRIEAVEIGTNKDYNLTAASYPCAIKTPPLIFPTTFYKSQKLKINRLCVNDGNNMKEVSCSLSHVKAILAALNSDNTNQYAMIIEDDMMIAFDIDFKELMSKIPSDFGILQVFTINYIDSTNLAEKYVVEGQISVPWEPHHWATGGYIMNKKVMRKIYEPLLWQNGPVFEMDFISADNVTRSPAYCFKDGKEIPEFPCVLSRFDVPQHGILGGIAADYFIYCLAYGHTYTTTIPLIQGSNLAYQSTISERHSEFDRISIDTSRLVIQDMYWGKMDIPSYAKLNSFEIYYINHPRAVKGKFRDKAVAAHLATLGYSYQRIEAVTIRKRDIVYNISEASYPCTKNQPITLESSILGSKYVKIRSLCIHPLNTLYEMTVLLSHIKAILSVLASPNNNPYVLVIEDDMQVVFESIDIEYYILRFPLDFCAVQTALLNKHALGWHMTEYIKQGKKHIDWESQFSSARGYILSKKALLASPEIQALIEQKNSETFEIDLIGVTSYTDSNGKKHCYPARCCADNGDPLPYRYPCIKSNMGITSNEYIYNLFSSIGKVYIATTPLIVSNPLLCTRGSWWCEVLRKNNAKIQETFK